MLAGVVAITVLFSLSLPQLETREDESTWMADDHPARLEYDRFRDLFGSAVFIVVAYESPDPFSRAEIEYLDYLSGRLVQLPHITGVSSLTATEEVVTTDSGVVSRPILRPSDSPRNAAERNQLEARIAANPFVYGTLISGDCRVVGIVLDVEASLDGEAYRWITSELELLLDHEGETDGRRFYYGGRPIYDATINEIMQRDIRTFLPLTILVSGLVLCTLFRHWRAVVFPLMAVMLALSWTFGLKAVLGIPVTPVSSTLVALIVIIGVANSVHFIAHYRLELARRRRARHALLATFSRAGVPCFLTSVTTAVGFGSLVISDIPLIRDLGIFAVFGIMSAFVLTMVLLAVGLGPARLTHGAAAVHFKAWTMVGDFVVRNARLVIVVWVIFASVVAMGTTRVEVEPSMTQYLKEDATVRQAADFIDARLSGSSSIELHLEGPPGVFERVSSLRAVSHLQNMVENRAFVARSTSPVDFIMRLHEGGLPPTDTAADRSFRFLERANEFDFDRYYVAGATDSLRVSINTRQMHLDEREAIIEDIEQYVASEMPEAALVVTGPEGMVNEVTVNVVRTQVFSVGIAILVILLLMFLFFGPRGALAALLPTILPIAILFGAMGIGGFQLNVATITVAAICIGLVVDDTVHYFSHFRRLMLRTGNAEEAATGALQEVGTALAFTSLTLSLGFAVMMLSESAFLVDFGILAIAALVAAFVVDVTIGPAILSRGGFRHLHSWIGRKPAARFQGPGHETKPTQAQPNHGENQGWARGE